jgi:hypothetical protein
MSDIKSPPPSWYEPPNDPERFCQDCVRYETGHCLNEDSVFYHKPMDPEDSCEEWEDYDPRDDEPPDFDEWREEHGH